MSLSAAGRRLASAWPGAPGVPPHESDQPFPAGAVVALADLKR